MSAKVTARGRRSSVVAANRGNYKTNSPRLMKRVLERDEWRCQKCGSLENLQIHHKIKRSQLGNGSLDNLVTLCARCHMAEHGQLTYTIPAAKVCSTSKSRTK